MVVKDWTPRDIRHLREQMRKTQAEFAAILDVALWTVSRWENGMRPRNGVLRQLDTLDRQMDAQG